MARVTLSEPLVMTDEQRQVYEIFPANLTRGLLLTGPSAAAYLALGGSFRRSKLDAKDRELVILRVGALSNCEYERMQHIPIARSVGWLDSEIDAIDAGDQRGLSPRSAVLLRFVDECVYRVKVTPKTFAELKKEFSDEVIAEITLLIGHYMMTARFLETLDIELDDAATSWDAVPQ